MFLQKPQRLRHLLRGGGITDRSVSGNTVVLGQQLPIPFSVPIITQAWNELANDNLTAIAPTHLYVRFLPDDLGELSTLLDLETTDDLDFDMYPLDHEIIQEGDFYQDPAIPVGEITWFYTTVPVGYSFPAIQYEILEPLVLVPYMTHLTKRAYELAGVPYDDSWINDFGGGGGGNEDPIDCDPECPNWPCCYEEGIPCYDPDEPCDGCCDCFPGTPNWPECLDPDGGGEDPEPPAFDLNACGCRKPSNTRHPGGCIQVVDTQINPEPGVREVKVIVKNTPFSHKSTYTDENGCWSINKKLAGKVRVKVKFENSKCKIRAIREWGESLWQYALILTDHNTYYGPTYNDIQILYVQNSNLNSVGRALWFGATGNNALFEHHGFTSGDGVANPPDNLSILLTPASGGEAAPMLGKLNNNLLSTINMATFINTYFPVPVGGPLGSATIPLNPFVVFLNLFAPDIVFNHGDDGLSPSDNIKESWYHEFSHASHFAGVSNNYWLDNIYYVIDNNGYGDGTATGAGRCAVIESWGFHYGPVCADYQYGLNHSLNTGLPSMQNATRHIYALEGFTPILPPTTTNSWIPQGVYLDCIDNNATNPSGVADGVADPTVMGFTHADCYSAITADPANPTIVRDRLTTFHLPIGQTIPTVNALFTLYGF